MIPEIESVPRHEIEYIAAQYADQLSSSLRYERYISRAALPDWVTRLGPDVLEATHPIAMLLITSDFIEYNETHGLNLSTLEKQLLLTAALLHDLGELKIDGIGSGDITYERRGEAEEKTELSIFMRIMHDVQDDPQKELMIKAYTEVVYNKDSKLGKMFNAIERVGYMKTAIRAFTNVDAFKIRNSQGLVGNVLSNQIVALLKYQEEYPYVDDFLIHYDKEITAMLKSTPSEWFNRVPKANDGKPFYNKKKVRAAKRSWGN